MACTSCPYQNDNLSLSTSLPFKRLIDLFNCFETKKILHLRPRIVNFREITVIYYIAKINKPILFLSYVFQMYNYYQFHCINLFVYINLITYSTEINMISIIFVYTVLRNINRWTKSFRM